MRTTYRNVLTLIATSALLAASLVTASPRALASAHLAASACPWTSPTVVASHTPTQLANMIIAQMTPAQEAAMVNLYNVNGDVAQNRYPGNAALCIPSFVMEDGPNGPLLTGGTSMPDSVAVGASFDPALAERYGVTMGQTATLDGISVVQAPSINTTQMPTWGRANETFGEDPFLTGLMATAEATGIESTGTQVDVKHVGAYIQEYDRGMARMTISQRGLEESYLSPLRPFLATNPLSAMCAYGILNGTTQCASAPLMKDLTDLGYRSWFVRSDLDAVDGMAPAALNAGLDVVKPAAPADILAAVNNNTLPKSALDRAVRDVLTAMFSHGMFTTQRSFNLLPSTVTPASLATSVATNEEGTVLLKNDGTLPLPRSAKVAVIEQSDYQSAMYAASGSSYVYAYPSGRVSPAAGLAAVLGARNVTSTLTTTPTPTQLLTPAVLAAASVTNGIERATLTYQLSSPATVDLSLVGPCCNAATATMSLDGAIFAQYAVALSGGVHSSDHTLSLAAGTHTITVTWPADQVTPQVTVVVVDSALAQAVAAAKAAPYAVVVVSTAEGEGVDRASLSLPGYQDQLVSAVAAANPHTIVVIDSGGAVLMPWLSSVAGVLEQWFPGQTDGTALAALLTGAVDPSGHLPLTFPASSAAVPYSDLTDGTSFSLNGPDGVGLLVGYHWYRATNNTPLFPFGYGLSYTSFVLSAPTIAPSSDGWTVSVRVTNTGHVAGRAVVQGYVSDPPAAQEPANSLKLVGSAEIAAGQTVTVSMDLTNQSLETYQSGSWTLVPGTYELRLGQSSTDLTQTIYF